MKGQELLRTDRRRIPVQFDLDFALTVVLSVADPDFSQLLPFAVTILDREPRSRHKVNAFQSQPCPQAIQTDSLDGPAGDEVRQAVGGHVEFVPSVQWDTGRG